MDDSLFSNDLTFSGSASSALAPASTPNVNSSNQNSSNTGGFDNSILSLASTLGQDYLASTSKTTQQTVNGLSTAATANSAAATAAAATQKNLLIALGAVVVLGGLIFALKK